MSKGTRRLKELGFTMFRSGEKGINYLTEQYIKRTKENCEKVKMYGQTIHGDLVDGLEKDAIEITINRFDFNRFIRIYPISTDNLIDDKNIDYKIVKAALLRAKEFAKEVDRNV